MHLDNHYCNNQSEILKRRNALSVIELQFTKAVSDTVLDMINAAYYNKPLIFTRATFWEKLVSHHQAVIKNG